MCLLSFPGLSEYLSTFEDKEFIDKKGILFQCVECNKFLKALSSGNESGKNDKNNELDSSLYDLSEKLYEKELINHLRCKKDIEPIYIINFLLKEVNNEIRKLNKLNINKNNNNNNDIIIQNEIYNERNNKEKSFEKYWQFYNNNFKTKISDDFFGTFKTKRLCLEKKLQEYSYNFFYSICFDVKGILSENNGENKITIYDAFYYFNKKYIKLDLNKYNLIDDCKESNNHYEYKQFYRIPNNLIIFLDRGEKCQYKEMIDFDERLILKKEHVESYKQFNTEVIYDLCSIISRIEEMNLNTKRRETKYIYYKRNKNGKYQREEKEKEYDLKEVKYTGDIISLFYLYQGNQNISPKKKKDDNNHQKIENNQVNISGNIERNINRKISQNNEIDNNHQNSQTDNNQANVNVNTGSSINQNINQNINQINDNYQNRQTEDNQDNDSVNTTICLNENLQS